MDKEEAVNRLGRKTVWKRDYAEEICEALDLEFPSKLVKRLETEAEAREWGLYHDIELPVECVDGFKLSSWVAERLGVRVKAESYLGRGSQAREYANKIREEVL